MRSRAAAYVRQHHLALLALFVALGGTSYAAVSLPRNSVGTAQLKKNAVTTAKVKNRSLVLADFKTAERAKLRGAKGDTGPAGAPGTPGAKGDKGDAGPFPDVLPSGKTLRGVYNFQDYAEAAGETESTAVSFLFTMASAPTHHYVRNGDAAPTECPGSVTNPQAQAGHLCLYELEAVKVDDRDAYNVTTNATGSVSKEGFGVYATSNDAGNYYILGSWAATSP